jgi:hypothetical protein
MPTKNIYIKESDVPLVERAEKNLPPDSSLSSLFVEFLKERFPAGLTRGSKLQKIKLSVGDPPITKVFEGTWLFGNGDRFGIHAEPDENSFVQWSSKVYYSAALTKKGQIAMYEWDEDDETGRMEVFKDFDEIREALIDNRYPAYPENILAAVAHAMKVPFEINEDI